ncbi:hypothetical protein ACA910_004426 [Epithemia clementina (nom. ined.)]
MMNGGASTTSNNNDDIAAAEEPPATAISSTLLNSVNVWDAAASNEKAVHYVVRHPWQWVMEDLASGLNNMQPEESPFNLPLAKQHVLLQQQQQQQSSSTAGPTSRAAARQYSRRGMKTNMSQGRASLRLEVVDKATGQVELAVHGTSGCFEGLADKDELVRTIQRCRCDHLHLSPPSILIQWDVNHEECLNVVGTTLPVIAPAPTTDGDESKEKRLSSNFAVLKEPMGSQGKGIFFVRNAEEIYEIIDRNHKRAAEEPDLLENLIAMKGRIPSWVLQAEVYPSLLIRDRRKFHIRSYVVVVERPDDEMLDMYIYSRHEVRIAGMPVEDDEEDSGKILNGAGGAVLTPDDVKHRPGRNPLAHITNGALSGTTERVVLDQVPELMDLNLAQKLEVFLAQVFGKYLLPDISRRISQSTFSTPPTATGMSLSPIRQFAVAGLDLMVTEDLRLFLLEVNVNPAAPPRHLCDERFDRHLHGFFRNLVNLVTMMSNNNSNGEEEGQSSSSRENFLDAFEILERQQQEGETEEASGTPP